MWRLVLLVLSLASVATNAANATVPCTIAIDPSITYFQGAYYSGAGANLVSLFASTPNATTLTLENTAYVIGTVNHVTCANSSATFPYNGNQDNLYISCLSNQTGPAVFLDCPNTTLSHSPNGWLATNAVCQVQPFICIIAPPTAPPLPPCSIALDPSIGHFSGAYYTGAGASGAGAFTSTSGASVFTLPSTNEVAGGLGVTCANSNQLFPYDANTDYFYISCLSNTAGPAFFLDCPWQALATDPGCVSRPFVCVSGATTYPPIAISETPAPPTTYPPCTILIDSSIEQFSGAYYSGAGTTLQSTFVSTQFASFFTIPSTSQVVGGMSITCTNSNQIFPYNVGTANAYISCLSNTTGPAVLLVCPGTDLANNVACQVHSFVCVNPPTTPAPTTSPPTPIPFVGCNVQLSSGFESVTTHDSVNGWIVQPGGTTVNIKLSEVLQVYRPRCHSEQALSSLVLGIDMYEQYTCLGQTTSYTLCMNVCENGACSPYQSLRLDGCCSSNSTSYPCGFGNLTSYHCEPAGSSPCTLNITGNGVASAIVTDATYYPPTQYYLNQSNPVATVSAGYQLTVSPPTCTSSDNSVATAELLTNAVVYTCNTTGGESLQWEQACVPHSVCSYPVPDSVSLLIAYQDLTGISHAVGQGTFLFPQPSSLYTMKLQCSTGYDTPQPSYTYYHPMIRYECTANAVICIYYCTAYYDTTSCSPTAAACVTNLIGTPYAPQCSPHSCEIVMGPMASTLDVSGEIYTNNNGVLTIPIQQGVSGTLTDYCPLTGGPFLNPSVSFDCAYGNPVDVFEVPACVSSCPGIQTWDGQECVCPIGTEDTCHTCGPLGNCNGRGICTPTQDYSGNSFCVCRDNYGGEFCEIDPVLSSCTAEGDVTVCDLPFTNQPCGCGILWSQLAIGGSFSMTPYALYTSYVDMDKRIDSSASSPTLIINQPQTFRAAKRSCASDPDCDGIVFLPATNQFTPITISFGAGYSRPSWVTDLTVTYTIWHADRISLYNCAGGATLDPYWYYFESGYQAEIESLFLCDTCCAVGNEPDGVCGIGQVPFNGGDSSQNWYSAAVKHWKFYGHVRRYSPNANCILAPTIYDPATMCGTARPGCEQTDAQDVPCSTHGYCTQSSDSSLHQRPYYCQCLGYAPMEVQGDFVVIPKYMGYACQYVTASFCATPNGPSGQVDFCNEMENRCQPLVLDNNGPLLSGIVDYVPGCKCDAFTDAFTGAFVAASSYEGTYCTNSRCNNDTYACDPPLGNTPGDGLSQCENIAPIGQPSTYECVCGYTRTGSQCQYSTAACTYSGPGADVTLPCGSHGTCNPPGLSAALYGDVPNYVFNQSWCQCQPTSVDSLTTYTGQYCYDQTCNPISTLVPGHGLCNNGVKQCCYPVYGGFTCQNKLCEISNGTTVNQTTCDCPYSEGLTLNPNSVIGNSNCFGTTNDPTCWPRCPDDPKTGATCGNSVNVCSMTQLSGGHKSAVCQCRTDLGWLPNTTYVDPVLGTTTMCYQYCLNSGTIPSGWTSTNGKPCNCPANSPYLSSTTYPRCDQPRCGLNGNWDPIGLTCTCNVLYYGSSCQYNSCDNPSTTTIVEGSPQGGYCKCSIGYATNAPSGALTNCAATVCGANGVLNPSYVSGVSSPISLCTCNAIFLTATPCTLTSCSYCTSSYCENGGYPTGQYDLDCFCYFPYISLQPGGYCSYTDCAQSLKTKNNNQCPTHVCGANGVPNVKTCTCTNGWKSPAANTNLQGLCTSAPCCTISPCASGCTWNQTSTRCMCPVATLPTPAPTVSCGPYGLVVANVFCSCASLWTGAACNISLCVGGTYNPTTHACACRPNYSGTFCEVYTAPPTTGPPTTVPPTTIPPTTPPPTHSSSSSSSSIVAFGAIDLLFVLLWGWLTLMCAIAWQDQ